MNEALFNEISHEARVAFVAELAARLHNYGTSAQRLEGAIDAVSRRLGMACEAWSNPTGLILSFSDPQRPEQPSAIRIIRLEPGDINLGRMAAADAIAEDVMAGRRDLASGHQALVALDRPVSVRGQVLTAFSFGLSAASVAGLLRTGWADIVTAAVIGWLIGTLQVLGARKRALNEAMDALSALIATFLAATVATFIAPLSLKTVIVASLIVLMPGLTLTTAVTELSSKQLVSGTARFAGAMMTLMSLTFGTVVAMQIVKMLGWQPQIAHGTQLPELVELGALLVASYAFAVLFKASKRDYLLVMASVWLGWGLTQVGDLVFSRADDAFAGGVFFAGIGVALVANAYARWFNRPGALIRVPGIILMVPGSVGFRSLSFVMQRDVLLGLNTGTALLSALIALVAGLLFGNLIMPSRRNL
jgi:uncharacterized membrane protein YjjP (DUF1212 family)